MPMRVTHDAELITPDRTFVKEIIALGGDAVKQCFQCGACSITCPLSPDENPFPRKEMIWAQWGLKERLLRDADVWLCHQCNDCSKYCPRGGRPGDLMAAIQSYAIMEFAVPGIFARAFARPQWLPALIGVAILFLFGFLAAIGSLTFPAGEVAYYRFISIANMEIAGSIVMAVAFAVAALGIFRFWRYLGVVEPSSLNTRRPGAGAATRGSSSGGSIWSGVVPALIDILTHRKFRMCGEDTHRYYAHLAILYGFILLCLATLGRALYYWFAGNSAAPPLTDPVKIAGNLGALLLTVGVTIAIYYRLSKKSASSRGGYFDWFFLLVLYATALTGVATQFARLAQIGALAYWIYLSHLLFAFMLLAYAPYSKFAHFLYRALAMMRAGQLGREAMERQEDGRVPAPAPLLEQ